MSNVWPQVRERRRRRIWRAACQSAIETALLRTYDGGMSHTVVAELVAAVMKVEVQVGQTVAADDPVVILESMKMEIPVLADVAGSVSEIVVAAAMLVNDGDPLVVISQQPIARP